MTKLTKTNDYKNKDSFTGGGVGRAVRMTSGLFQLSARG